MNPPRPASAAASILPEPAPASPGAPLAPRPVVAGVGVYTPQADSFLLREALTAELAKASGPLDVLDLCCGTGIQALAAAALGHKATAVDASGSAVANACANARAHRVMIEALHGDLFAPVAGRRFDIVTANPPYVPTPPPDLQPGIQRHISFDGGPDGRRLIDRICAGAVKHLRPGGSLLMVQSSMANVERTIALLAQRDLRSTVVRRRDEPLGAISLERRPYLVESGFLAAEAAYEELVVLKAKFAPQLTAASNAIARPAAPVARRPTI